jgi:hypothetical protein
MKGNLVFISTIEVHEEEWPDIGVSGLGTDDEVIERAKDAIAELWGQDGPAEPWFLTDEQLTALEATLPIEGKAR